MRKYVLVFMGLFITTLAIAQNDSIVQPQEEGHKPEYGRMYLLLPGAVGNNVLADANRGVIGIGTSGSLPSFYNFYLGAGVELMHYEVTDKALAGNITSTNITTVFAELFYKIQLAKDISVNPRIAVGSFFMSQKKDTKDYGNQDGPIYTVGINVDYRLVGWLKGFVGLNYSKLNGEITTNAEYSDFFNDMCQLNIVFGLKF